MLTLITSFIEELRAVGVPVSMVEAIDAMSALDHVDLAERTAFKEALRATLIKNSRHEPAFETAFEVFFADRSRLLAMEPDELPESSQSGESSGTGGSGGGSMDLEELIESLFNALSDQDFAALRSAARDAVDQLAGMEPGRPVGGTYYLYRTLRQLDIDMLEQRLLEAVMAEHSDDIDVLEERLVREEVAARIERLREELTEEIRRRLVEDRGHEAVAKTLRKPLTEELDLMHATRHDLEAIEEIVEPLTRKLAARLARKRRNQNKGRLDFRKTMRSSLATGGVPVEPKFKNARPHKPELFLICDISGSMATFARFTLQFTYAMASQFSRLRAFVFVDAVDEVTDFLKPGTDFKDALVRISTEADVVWLDGHSDYGHAFEQFMSRYGREITPRTTVIITGDARNNYREPREQHLAEIAGSAKALYWLNPEPTGYWDSGDSVMSRYARFCDDVYEVRNLRQLEAFVESIAVQSHIVRSRPASLRGAGRGTGRKVLNSTL